MSTLARAKSSPRLNFRTSAGDYTVILPYGAVQQTAGSVLSYDLMPLFEALRPFCEPQTVGEKTG